MKKLWSDIEIKFLKENYIKLSAEDLTEKLGRPWHGIKLKAHKLNLLKHSINKDEIAADYTNLSLQDLLKKYDIGQTTLYRILDEKNIKRNIITIQKIWTEDEIVFLKDNYTSEDSELISNLLGRSWSSIVQKANKLGLSRDIVIDPMIIIEYKNGVPLKDLLVKYNVSQTTFYRFLKAQATGKVTKTYAHKNKGEFKGDFNVEQFKIDYTVLESDDICNKYKLTRATMCKRGSQLNLIRPTHLSSESRKKSNLQLYGVAHALQNKQIKALQKKTHLERYGCEYPLQNPKSLQKFRNTCMENYGVPHIPNNCYGKIQKEIQDWLNSFGFNFQSDYKILDGKEIDLYDDTLKLGIEYCGLYWHHENSPEPRDKNYHNNKRLACEAQGVRLITIFEDEWLDRQEQCKNFLKSVLNKNSIKLYARKCIVKLIDKKVGQAFIEQHHIQGTNYLGLYFAGLYHQEELVGVLSFGRHHRIADQLTLDRLCFKSDISVIGGSSKLLNFLLNEIKPTSLISWSDNRWSQGKVYEQLGFKLEEELKPDYSYVVTNGSNIRYSKQSQKNKPEDDPNISEYERCLNKGLSRIWDCGKKRWVLVYKV